MCKKGEIRNNADGSLCSEQFFKELPKYPNIIPVKGLVEETLDALKDLS